MIEDNLIKISVIMSCYNEPIKYFKMAVDSILSQNFNFFEFIIILDNPKNKELEKEILKYIKKDKRIIYLKNKKNLGLAQSLNIGIKIAKGKYIARMDSDDISRSNRLKVQYNYLENNSKSDLLFTYVKYIDEDNKFIKNFNPSKKKIKKINNYYFKDLLLVHPSLFCKSEILKNNLYDIKQSRSQDFELWLRLISKNYKFDIIENYLLNYRILNINNLENRIKKVKNSYKYSLIALNKNFLKIILMDGFILFYLNSLFMNFILLIFPIKFIKYLVLIKDRLN